MDEWRYNYRSDHSDRTAIGRRALSSPSRWLRAHKLVHQPCLDYGCGRGSDADRLGCACYDPGLQPKAQNVAALQSQYRTILVHYVLNTVPSASTRAKILADVRKLLLPGGAAYVAVRTDKRALRGRTSRGTWQGEITLPGKPFARGSGWVMWKLTPRKERKMARRKNPRSKSSYPTNIATLLPNGKLWHLDTLENRSTLQEAIGEAQAMGYTVLRAKSYFSPSKTDPVWMVVVRQSVARNPSDDDGWDYVDPVLDEWAGWVSESEYGVHRYSAVHLLGPNDEPVCGTRNRLDWPWVAGSDSLGTRCKKCDRYWMKRR